RRKGSPRSIRIPRCGRFSIEVSPAYQAGTGRAGGTPSTGAPGRLGREVSSGRDDDEGRKPAPANGSARGRRQGERTEGKPCRAAALELVDRTVGTGF